MRGQLDAHECRTAKGTKKRFVGNDQKLRAESRGPVREPVRAGQTDESVGLAGTVLNAGRRRRRFKPETAAAAEMMMR